MTVVVSLVLVNVMKKVYKNKVEHIVCPINFSRSPNFTHTLCSEGGVRVISWQSVITQLLRAQSSLDNFNNLIGTNNSFTRMVGVVLVLGKIYIWFLLTDVPFLFQNEPINRKYYVFPLQKITVF